MIILFFGKFLNRFCWGLSQQAEKPLPNITKVEQFPRVRWGLRAWIEKVSPYLELELLNGAYHPPGESPKNEFSAGGFF